MAWSHVPQETFEAILQYLDLHSLKSLRLVNRTFSTRCLGPYFLSFFENVSTDLTQSSLQYLYTRASHSTLKYALGNLTILATAYDLSRAQEILVTKQRIVRESNGPMMTVTFEKCAEEELSAVQSNLDWLQTQREARDALADEFIIDSLASSLKCIEKIPTIRLDAMVIEAPKGSRPHLMGEWQAIWSRASRVHYLTMSAIVRSGVAVNSLDIFSQTPRCSVPSADITAHLARLNQDDLRTACAQIKNIALSISTKVEVDLEKSVTFPGSSRNPERDSRRILGSLDAADPQTLSDDNYPGLAQLLMTTPNLTTLYLHLYRTVTGNIKTFDRLFTSVSHNVCLPKLEVCSLSGLFVAENTMLRFLENHPCLRHVEFEELNLTSGSWEPIFRCMSKMTGLRYLRLSSLWGVRDRLENLQPTWAAWPPDRSLRNSCFPSDEPMLYQREFSAQDLKLGLQFLPSPYPRLKGSFQLMRWRERRRTNYGPP